MYKMKYIFGQMVNYQGEKRKVMGIRFSVEGIMYKLKGIKEWIKESEI